MGRIFSEAVSTKGPGFWSRQFGALPTDAQEMFDMALGVVLPIVCFVVDPTVFKGGVFGAPMLEEYRLLAYIVSAIEVAMLLFWLRGRTHVRTFSAPFAGVFIVGAVFSTLIGLVILPFTLIGSLMVVGLAGFTPFLTGFVYLRNGVRAMRWQLCNATFEFRFLTAALAGVLVIALPILGSMQVSQATSAAVATLVYGNAIEAEDAANQLKWLPFVTTGQLQQIAHAYQHESDQRKRDVLKRVYKKIDGGDIEHWHRLFD